MKKETGRRVKDPEADLEGAANLAGSLRPFHDLIRFPCQQSAEKYLKALLIEVGVAFPKTHRLEDLLMLLLPHYPSLKNLRRNVVSLTRYAVDLSVSRRERNEA